ncbi:alcohol dehydrogenase [Mycobacterium sp. PS03-16]|uniref:alcohol dehydrogenase catalytic domain-containing protein n=1 Tax=Mycobacterium sp. PS03-16 TaxID=2559611 RepID=UPI0010743DD3|nr:alcohol dehydrogenase catalytic domain-containing protein [Mycobacterium sp. PS03-16]TFV57885.1 alcohol dehydrogenase [Mycobacterium sp. PS03-16]
MPTYRTVDVNTPSGPLELADREIAEPGPGTVRIRVEACGVCHSDSQLAAGHLPGTVFPMTPGHEIAGRIDAVGGDVQEWRLGDRVAVGWSGGYCGHCFFCRRGEFMHCEYAKVTGAAFRGGYAEMIVAPTSALARIPDELGAAEAAPLACAGVTMFNSLRHTGAMPGDVVAILGIGGLGHLGVQFAVKMGFRTVAVARGSEKCDMAEQLGAHHYIDSTVSDVAVELRKLGGARVIAATVTNSAAMSATIDGLAPHGELLTLGVSADPIAVTPLQLINTTGTVHGHPAGTAADIEDTLNFSALQGIRPWIEEFPLKSVADGYDRMMRNEARFRVVLRMS